MKKIGFLFLIFVIKVQVYGQEILNFPIENAFYSQESNGYYKGSIKVLNPSNTPLSYSLLIYKDAQKAFHKKLSSNKNIDIEFELKSGLFEYRFQLFKHSQKDSTLIKSASKVLCGDAFVIYGQSNGSAFSGVEYYTQSNFNDKWLRNINLNSTNKYAWFPILQPYANVGTTGLTFSKLIADSLKVPVAIINGSVGGQNLETLSYRNSSNPKDANTFYGALLSRVTAFNTIKTLKGFFWISGESEAFGSSAEMAQFPDKFDVLYQNIKIDFPPVERFIVLQTNLLNVGSVGNAGQVRDLMTKLMDSYPNLQTLGTAGITPHYSGIHYSRLGYEKIAEKLFQFYKHNVYKNPLDTTFKSPRLIKAVKDYSINRLRLIFESTQKVNLPDGVNGVQVYRTTTGVIFIDDKNYQLTEIENFKNEIQLGLLDLKSARNITYLPSFYVDQYSDHYDGPVITNQHGFVALTFYQFPIQEMLEIPEIIGQSNDSNTVQFSFKSTKPCINCQLKVLRKMPNENKYNLLKSIDYPISSFTDVIPDSYKKNIPINYKFYLENDLSFSNEIEKTVYFCIDKYLKTTLDFQYYFNGNKLSIIKSLGNDNYKIISEKNSLIVPLLKPSPFSTNSVQVEDCPN